MPSLQTLKKRNKGAKTPGEQRRTQSDLIMEQTWSGDLQSTKAYIYDFYNDNHPDKVRGYEPEDDTGKIEVDIKFIVAQYSTISKDQVEYHIQFKPSENLNDLIPYYQKRYGDEYGAEIPVGLYIDIYDRELEQWRKWLICAKEISNQFRKYLILPCDYVFTWILNNKKYLISGIARLRNSYNSGVWRDYITESIENQDQLFFPLNRYTAALYYNQRIIIDPIKPTKEELDSNLYEHEPITWRITKVESLHPIGIYKITVGQDKFNQFTDRFVDGYWYADYLKSEVETEDATTGYEKPGVDVKASISFSGTTAKISTKSYKDLYVTFMKSEEDITADYINDTVWSYIINGVETPITFVDNKFSDSQIAATKNEKGIRVRFLGSVLKVSKIEFKCVSKDVEDTQQFDIVEF